MPRLLLLALVCAALAGCVREPPSLSSTTPTTTVTPTTAVDHRCGVLDVTVDPQSGPVGSARNVTALFTNCGTLTIRLAHACMRGMDIVLDVLSNSTTPDSTTPGGSTVRATYPLDSPIAGSPLACATAPPHLRPVAAQTTKAYPVLWSGWVADAGCSAGTCARPLPPGHYLVAAYATDADSGRSYVATAWLIVQ